LFLVDGRRTLDEVIELGLQAGVPKGYIDELLALGLVVMGAPMRSPLAEDHAPLSPTADQPQPTTQFDNVERADTQMMGLPLSNTELSALDELDPSFARARSLLLQLLREHGPVSTTVTLLRVRRARDRRNLLALLPEIRTRLARAGVAHALLQMVDQAEGWLNA
jgi:hypothetical protein